MPWLNLIGVGLVAAAGSYTVSVSSLFRLEGLARKFVAKARSDGMCGVVVVPFTPSDPTWPALAAASLTSVVGQRDPCMVLSDPAAYVRVGDDLGGTQCLAVMAVDFGRWSQNASVGFAPPCGWHAERNRFRASWTPRIASAWQRPLASVDRGAYSLQGQCS